MSASRPSPGVLGPGRPDDLRLEDIEAELQNIRRILNEAIAPAAARARSIAADKNAADLAFGGSAELDREQICTTFVATHLQFVDTRLKQLASCVKREADHRNAQLQAIGHYRDWYSWPASGSETRYHTDEEPSW